MDILGRLKGLFSTSDSPIADAGQLAAFMDSRAAFLSQKGIVEFCRVRAGIYWQKLFSEAEFQEALTLSCWRAYPPAYAMVAEMVEGVLRPAAGSRRPRLGGSLVALAERTFDGYPTPKGAEPPFWQEAVALVSARLDTIQGQPAQPVREIPKALARQVFDVLPIHKQVVSRDFDYIFNNLRMNLLRAHEDFLEAAEPVSLVDDLLGRDQVPGG